MASSSSSVNIQAKYDVFLSFRGEDTRHNFTSHLYSALIKKDVAAFIDDDGLERGDEISPALLKAIEDSVISVIIFSKDYAASRWCLDELARIIECKNTNGQIVVPIFYHIEPTDVRKQTGSFEKAFVVHEERFKETPERVQIWRAALTQAADLSGYHVMKNRPEAKSVDEIVEDLLKKLTEKSSVTGGCEDLVGINSRIEQVRTLLSKSQVIGIWGMGGIGKTTIAEILFNQISRDFDGCCFIENVREELEKSGGGLLQQRIISKVLGEKNHVFDTPNTIPQYTKNRLQRKKVLIALDDVNDSGKLEGLIRGLKPLSQESKIIITTRDKQVLLSNEVNNIYEVKELNNYEALLLFCKCAFKQNYPSKDLQQLLYMMIKYAGGNPLAIRVVGSALYGKSKEEWDSVKDNFNEIGGTKISKMLNIGFDALEDTEKKIFLDIACFFKGENEDLAKQVLKACYPSSLYFLGNLINKSLIKISNCKLQMHDLLQEMGRRIVCQESKNNPGERTRLWRYNDIYDVLQNNKGTEAVESILLDMSRLNEMHLSSNAFVNMTNLRLLKLFYCPYVHSKYHINRVCLPQGLEYLSNKLIYLRWDGYPLKALPSKFSGEKLVALELPHSNIERPLEETKHDSSLLGPFLERGKRLLKVPSSIQYFRNLHILNMGGCRYLKRFPRNIHFESSIAIDLSGCINLTEFPQISGNVKILLLSETAIEEVPTTIASLSELEHLVMYHCGKLKRISTSIWKLRTLGVLDLHGCFKLETLPEITEEMENLKWLSLSETAIKELPPSFENLTALEQLFLDQCEHLESFPHSMGDLLYLGEFGELGTARSQLSSSFALLKKLSRFRYLELSYCNLTEFPEVICSLSSLEYLCLDGNYFKSIPKSIKQLSKLESLSLENCDLLQSIPELPCKLETLSANHCKRLQSLPELPSNEEQFDHKEDFGWCLEKYFSFVNCLNLKENVSLQRIRHMATVLQHSYGKVTGFYFTLPGSEIPNWFNYRNFGSSIIIELPQQYCCNRRLIGFALSVVVPFHDSSRNYIDRHNVCVICKPSYALDYSYGVVGSVSSIQSDHIVICLYPCTDVRLLEGQCTTITFNFFCLNDFPQDAKPPCEFKCCGVHPIYEESNMALFDTCIERFSSTHEDLKEAILVDCSNTSGSGDSRSSDEKLEPHSKIFRRN